MQKKYNQVQLTRGFSLIELLIVVAILVILLTTTLVIFKPFGRVSQARDLKRISAMNQIRDALAQYYFTENHYPECDICCNSAVESCDSNDYECKETPPRAEQWECMINELKSKNLLVNIQGTLQDPLYDPAIYAYSYMEPYMEIPGNENAFETYPYVYQYMSGHSAEGADDFVTYRIKAHLENQDNNILATGYSGNFWYDDEETGSYACESKIGDYCLGPSKDLATFISGKPVIYLYPTQEQKVSVKISPKNIMASEPLYNNGWEVIASPNGNLLNLTDQKTYPYLFWEGASRTPKVDQTKGFVVAQNQVSNFLDEKLGLLGLNAKETTDFKEFWLPRLSKKAYTYLYFMPQSDFDELVPIQIEPKPDTVIRVYFLFKSLDQPMMVEEQKLSAPHRTGFTAVEWGGDLIEIK